MNVDTPCWVTPFASTNGYAQATVGGRYQYVHRAIYELLVGTVPEDLELDHVCLNKACVNPWHLEPVTHAENVRRGRSGILQPRSDVCRNGHEFTSENTYLSAKGRVCRSCQAASQRRYREKRAS